MKFCTTRNLVFALFSMLLIVSCSKNKMERKYKDVESTGKGSVKVSSESSTLSPTHWEFFVRYEVGDTFEPLPGADIVIQGTTITTQTDIDGNASIAKSAGPSSGKFVVSFDGFLPITFNFTSSDSHFIVTLEEDVLIAK